jgi:glutathione peroxidase
MTIKHRILKALYPLVMKLSKASKNSTLLENKEKLAPAQPFTALKIVTNSGKELDFNQFKGKKVLLVNTASNCGYTGQFEELQQLHEQYQNNLVILGFPANDFKEQEKGSDGDIAQFCQLNYGVTFTLAKKSSVVRGNEQNPVYQWLTTPQLNGWNKHQPDWNFSKYLIDEQGTLTHYFGPSVSPSSEEVKQAIGK